MLDIDSLLFHSVVQGLAHVPVALVGTSPAIGSLGGLAYPASTSL